MNLSFHNYSSLHKQNYCQNGKISGKHTLRDPRSRLGLFLKIACEIIYGVVETFVDAKWAPEKRPPITYGG